MNFVYKAAKLVLGQEGCDTYDKKKVKYLNPASVLLQDFQYGLNLRLIPAAADGKLTKLHFQKWMSSYRCGAVSAMDAVSRVLLIAVVLYSY